MRCSSAWAPPSMALRSAAAHRTDVRDPIAVEVGGDLVGEVGLVLHDPGDDAAAVRPGAPPRSPRAVPLSGWIRPKNSRWSPGAGWRAKCVDVDAVVDRGGVGQRGPAIAVADGDVGAAVVVALVHPEDALRREAVDRGHDGRGDEAAVGQRQEVEPVVDEVELVGPLERGGDVRALRRLGVDRRVLGPPRRDHGGQGGVGHGIAAGEEGHARAPVRRGPRSAARRTAPTARSGSGAPAMRSGPAPRCAAGERRRRCAEGSTSPRYPAAGPARCRYAWGDPLVIRLVWAGRHVLPVAPCRLDVSTEPARGDACARTTRRWHPRLASAPGRRYAIVSTYPPTPCGVATFSAALTGGLRAGGADGRHRAPRRRGWRGPGSAGGRAHPAATPTWSCVQHEYGIYDGPDGDAVVGLLERLVRPSIVVAHTVLRSPTAHQRAVLEAAADAADARGGHDRGGPRSAVRELRRRRPRRSR